MVLRDTSASKNHDTPSSNFWLDIENEMIAKEPSLSLVEMKSNVGGNAKNGLKLDAPCFLKLSKIQKERNLRTHTEEKSTIFVL